MNTILLYLLMTPLFTGDSARIPPTDATEYYNDSLRLYDRYAYQINYLTTIKETDTAKWNAKALHDHLVTCGTQKDLSHHNKENYAPIDSFKRAGCETAYKYPKPFGVKKVNGVVVVNNEPENVRNPKLDHIFYDEQTRFAKNHKPYILKIRFNNSVVITEEKLKPIPNSDGTYPPFEE